MLDRRLRDWISGRRNRASSSDKRSSPQWTRSTQSNLSGGRMIKHSTLPVAFAVSMFVGGTVWSQDTTAKQEAPSTSVAPAVVEISPKTLDAHVGEKVKFSAAAKDSAGNPIDAKVSVWFAAPFDLAGADESGEVTFHAPGI